MATVMPTPAITTNTHLSTSVVTVTTTYTIMCTVSNSSMSSDSNDGCDIQGVLFYVVPTALVSIVLTMILCMCVVVVMRVTCKRRKSVDITKMENSITCIVENDLYQLVYSYIIVTLH